MATFESPIRRSEHLNRPHQLPSRLVVWAAKATSWGLLTLIVATAALFGAARTLKQWLFGG